MADPATIYVTILLIGIGLTLVVGQILIRSGRALLAEVFPRQETATSVTRLVVVLFHLVVLGILALVVTIDFTLATPMQTLVAKLGLVLLVLGAAYGATVALLIRVRDRRRAQMLVDQSNAQAAQQYAQTPYNGMATPVPEPHLNTGEPQARVHPAESQPGEPHYPHPDPTQQRP